VHGQWYYGMMWTVLVGAGGAARAAKYLTEDDLRDGAARERREQAQLRMLRAGVDDDLERSIAYAIRVVRVPAIRHRQDPSVFRFNRGNSPRNARVALKVSARAQRRSYIYDEPRL